MSAEGPVGGLATQKQLQGSDTLDSLSSTLNCVWGSKSASIRFVFFFLNYLRGRVEGLNKEKKNNIISLLVVLPSRLSH